MISKYSLKHVCGLHEFRPSRFFFIESFLQMCFEGMWLQNRLRANKNELRSLSAVDIQGHQLGGFCIVPTFPLMSPKSICTEKRDHLICYSLTMLYVQDFLRKARFHIISSVKLVAGAFSRDFVLVTRLPHSSEGSTISTEALLRLPKSGFV